MTMPPRTAHSWLFSALFLFSLLSGCGGDSAPPPQPPLATPLAKMELVAGSTAGDGNLDGDLASARFLEPGGMVQDRAGNRAGNPVGDRVGAIYLADSGNHTIRKIGSDGKVSKLAGTAGAAGALDGTAAAARFNHPQGLAQDDNGNLYVADSDNHLVRKISPDGTVTTLAGRAGVAGQADGVGAQASLNHPARIVFGPDRRLYLADSENGLIRTIDLNGRVGTLAIQGGNFSPVDGSPIAHRFGAIGGLAFDGAGNLYLSDSFYGIVYRIGSDGAASIFAGLPVLIDLDGRNSIDGKGRAAQFIAPGDISIDNQGNLFLTDFYTLRKITPDGLVSTLPGQPDELARPAALAVAADGSITVSSRNIHDHHINSTGGSALFRITPDGKFSQLAPQAKQVILIDGSGAPFVPGGIAALGSNGDGALYLAEAGGMVRKISANGQISTRMMIPDPAHGGVQQIYNPSAMALDGAGNIWLADLRSGIYRISANGTVALIAGNPADVSVLAPGTPAVFEQVAGLAALPDGTLYAADALLHAIYKITPGGSVSLLAGTPGSSGSNDGTGQAARFNTPAGLALDAKGNLYLADRGNHLVRKITPDGVVSTLAGRAGVAGDDDGAQATFGNLRDLAIDAMGNLYLTETGKHWLRKIGSDGVVSTVAGNRSQIGIAPGPLPGSLGLLTRGLALGPDGSVYFGSDQALLALRR
jgi:sugar lactone lactonase YvrE